MNGDRSAIAVAAALADLARFDTIIDVRSESEFAEDHMPGAVNCPVLSDTERIEVGTMDRQQSSFEAKRRGAAYVARNIARHLEETFADKPRSWKPLVYCWRGGNRSGALATVLARIGWHVSLLDGGYREFRRRVIADLDEMSPRFPRIPNSCVCTENRSPCSVSAAWLIRVVLPASPWRMSICSRCVSQSASAWRVGIGTTTGSRSASTKASRRRGRVVSSAALTAA